MKVCSRQYLKKAGERLLVYAALALIFVGLGLLIHAVAWLGAFVAGLLYSNGLL